jgi:hypothetical protein
VRWWLAAAFSIGCAAKERTAVPDRDDGFATVVVDAAVEPPVGLRLDTLDGGTIAIGDGDRPQLVYLSASYCKGCIESLPKLRALADAHSELAITYVLWDELDDAQAFARRHALPGTIAWVSKPAQQDLLARVLKYPVFPSFVLIDANGQVLATSRETKLDAIDALLSKR